MIKSEAINKLTEEKPRLIYISGKSSTGKTTFSNELREKFNYRIVELDQAVQRYVVEPFGVEPPTEAFVTVYRDTEPTEWIDAFVKGAKQDILASASVRPTTVEGAIAKARILQAIFSDELNDFVFIYLHPTNKTEYMNRIQQRFLEGAKHGSAGLLKDFWALVDKDDLDHFKSTSEVNEGIERAMGLYADRSMQESLARLEHFKESFPNLVVVEV